MSLQSYIFIGYQQIAFQRAEKVMSDSPGLVDFAIGQVLFFGKIQITEGLLSILPIKKGLGATAVVEMTCGLVHAIYSLP